MKSKFFTIAKRDYLAIVKSKSFIIATILIPIFWFAIIVVPGVLTAIFFQQTEMKIAIVDKTNKGIGKEIVASDPTAFFIEFSSENQLNKKILDGELEAYLVIDDESLKNNHVIVYTKGGGGIGFLAKIDKVVGKTFRKKLLFEKGLDTALIKQIESDVKVETRKVTQEGIKKDYSEFYSFFGYFAGIILFMLIFLYGGFVMRGVVEEKANRIVEILLSSVKPFDIMLGKVVGLGSVGLTQILIWLVLFAIISLFSGQIISLFITPQPSQSSISTGLAQQNPFPANFKIPPIPLEFFVFFIVYFLFGYFLIASIYAALGSAVDQEQDAQTLIAPINFIFLIPVFLISLMIANPNGTIPTLLSLFPPFTPVLMVARMSSTSVPLWQLLLSVVLMLLFIWLSVHISAKIYRIGILIYGKKPTLKEIFRWLRQA
ncbi:MAG: ABC transporter permease [Candidatus Kapaibacteriota bacterium]